jgi:hypothetical protein
MRFANIHQRWLPAVPEAAGALLDGLSSADDALWPRRWPPMRFDRPLAPGAAGGHGPIRYTVEAHEPGRLVSFRFDPRTGFRGRHWFEVVPVDGGSSLRHVLEGQSGPLGWLYWSVAVRPLHDALVEDALDRAERALTGAVRTPARWSTIVLVLRWLFASAR